MIGRNVNAYFSNYAECMQNIPCLLQEQISSALHFNTVQNRLFHKIENTSFMLKDTDDIEQPLSELISSLLLMNDIYDGKISEMNKLEERLEQLSQFMLSSKATVCSDDSQQLNQLTDAFRRSSENRNRVKSLENSYFNSPAPRDSAQPPLTQKQKSHRSALRRSSSDLILRGKKWMNTSRRRHRAANEVNHRGLPIGVISAQFRREKYEATIGRVSGQSSSYLLQRGGARNRGVSSSGSRIAAQQSRSIITAAISSRRLKSSEFLKGSRQCTSSLASDDSVNDHDQQRKVATSLSGRKSKRFGNDSSIKENQRFNKNDKFWLTGDDSITDDEDDSSLSNEEDDIEDEQLKSIGGRNSPLPYAKPGYKPTYRRRTPDPHIFPKRGGVTSGRRRPSTNSPKPLPEPSSSDDDNDDLEDDQLTIAGTPAIGGSSGGGGSSERLYCLCKKVSFGEMIACDNTRCEIEWFHFGCVDIRAQPKGKWYCPRCRGETSKVKRIDI